MLIYDHVPNIRILLVHTKHDTTVAGASDDGAGEGSALDDWGGGLVTHGKTARGASSPWRELSIKSLQRYRSDSYQKLFSGREKGQISA